MTNAQKPVAWIRCHPDGSLTEEILSDRSIEAARKASGAWKPLVHPADDEALQAASLLSQAQARVMVLEKVLNKADDWIAAARHAHWCNIENECDCDKYLVMREIMQALAGQAEPAPRLTDAEFEIHDSEGYYASTTGLREIAWSEAMRYAGQCEGAAQIFEVTRTLVAYPG